MSATGVIGLRLHDLRHFFASGLIASGCDVVTVQRALGHASATPTLNTYGRLWPDAEDRARAATDGLMAARSTILRTISGPNDVRGPLTWADTASYTLKRNSTTSPSAMT